jgi:hypothetical protein
MREQGTGADFQFDKGEHARASASAEWAFSVLIVLRMRVMRCGCQACQDDSDDQGCQWEANESARDGGTI